MMEKNPVLGYTVGFIIIAMLLAWENYQPTVRDNKVVLNGVHDYNPAFDNVDIALIEYVKPNLVSAVKLFNQGNYRGAMLLAEVASTRGEMRLQAQAGYLRGLCLQKLGNFEEANAEYTKVLFLTDKQELITRAKTGKAACAAHKKTIEPEQLKFPISSLGLPRGQTNLQFK
jgi:hypothetical protein